jgi:inosine-uridine nucleoside N-ribohydrolase
MAIPVILDCDPGVDDAAGILLAFARSELDVRAITTVGGNTSVAHTTRNTLDLLAYAGIDGVPVARGADRALLRPFHLGTHIHGATGFGGVALPESGRTTLAVPAVDLPQRPRGGAGRLPERRADHDGRIKRHAPRPLHAGAHRPIARHGA